MQGGESVSRKLATVSEESSLARKPVPSAVRSSIARVLPESP